VQLVVGAVVLEVVVEGQVVLDVRVQQHGRLVRPAPGVCACRFSAQGHDWDAHISVWHGRREGRGLTHLGTLRRV
jgi:hypothetical protein